MTQRTLEIAPLRTLPLAHHRERAHRVPARHAATRAAKTLLAFLALLCATALPARANTYYIDYAGGSNANAGTQASPWKSAPGMQIGAGCGGATHSYTPAAGDQLHLQGRRHLARSLFPVDNRRGGI